MKNLLKKLDYTYDSINEIERALNERGVNTVCSPLSNFGNLIRDIPHGDIYPNSFFMLLKHKTFVSNNNVELIPNQITLNTINISASNTPINIKNVIKNLNVIELISSNELIELVEIVHEGGTE